MWTLLLFLCASRSTSFLLFTLYSFQAWIVSSFFHCFHCCLWVLNFRRFLHGNEFVYQIKVVHRILTLGCDVVFVTSLKSRFHSPSCGSLDSTTHAYFLSLELGWVLQALKAKLAWMFLLSRHGRFHMHSQLSSCILDSLLQFVLLAVLWIHEIPLYKRTLFFQLCW